jgi:hypothetical protein
LQETERITFLLTTYQRNLEITESKLVAVQQENIDLHIQIQQLLHSGVGNPNSLQLPGQSKLPSDKISDVDQQKYMKVYESLTSEIKELRNQLTKPNQSIFETEKKISDATPPIIQKNQVKEASMALSASPPPTARPSMIQSIPDKNTKDYIQQLEMNASAAMSKQLQLAEKKATELSMRNTAVEEELKSYQSYMVYY